MATIKSFNTFRKEIKIKIKTNILKKRNKIKIKIHFLKSSSSPLKFIIAKSRDIPVIVNFGR